MAASTSSGWGITPLSPTVAQALSETNEKSSALVPTMMPTEGMPSAAPRCVSPRINTKQTTRSGNHFRNGSEAQARQNNHLSRHARGNLFAISSFLVVAPEKHAHDPVFGQFASHLRPTALGPQLFSSARIHGQRGVGRSDAVGVIGLTSSP